MFRRRPDVFRSGGFMLVLAVLAGLAGAGRGGDILRGGAVARGAGERSAAASQATAAEAARVRANAQDALKRTTRAVQDVRTMQAAARAAAAASAARNLGANPNAPGTLLPDVPDGLAPGGLEVDPGVAAGTAVWSGAASPVQSNAGSQALVNIRQTQQQALLSWRTFNVGRNTRVHFDQSAGGRDTTKWIAFNRITDPSGAPSQILGSISAPGQVYLLNQNGIIFGGTSQVNVHTLVASAVPINDNLVERGLLNQGRAVQFLFSALPQTGDPAFTPPPLPASGRIGDITVLSGARLAAPTSEAKVGGRVVLVGANVENRGTIDTPDGQTILAAGLQVGFEAHDANDASLRGLDTYVGQVGDYAGRAVNAGLINVPRGNLTITGREVAQLGAVDSSTSVSLNGRIDLRADYDALPNQAYDPAFATTSPPFLYGGGPSGSGTGLVTLGRGSVTRILPEWGSAEKVVGTRLALRSAVNLRGRAVHLAEGALVHAPNGDVAATTGVWDYVPSSPAARTSFVRAGGRIHLDAGAMINVAGTPDAFSPLSHHILTVTLRSSELADSPLQRETFFRGGEITVDLRKTGVFNGREWVGTPLADLRGYLGLIERTVDELTVGGGSIKLESGGAVVVQRGATLDASAGFFQYGGGTVRTTRLLYRGRLFDIADATPDRFYDGIYTGEFVVRHPKWGIEKTYVVPFMTGEHFQHGYLQGANAGSLALAGSALALDGMFRALAVSGPRQRAVPASGGALDLSFEVQQLVPGAALDPLVSPTPPQVVFGSGRLPPAGGFALDDAGEPLPLSDDRTRRVLIDPEWFAGGGFASLRVRNPDGDIVVPRGVDVVMPPLGSVVLQGANVSILGSVSAPGGNLEFAAYNISPSVAAALGQTGAPALPAPNPGRGRFTLGSGGALDVAGLVIDLRPTGKTPFSLPQVTTGGRVSIGTYSASLAAGSLIDVSGGVLAGPRGGMTYGNAGSLEILAGRDLSLSGVDGGRLQLGGTLRGYSGATGGSLSLQAQLIQIGGYLAHPLALNLPPDFFSTGGFSRFTLAGIGAPTDDPERFVPGVRIAAGTVIEPVVQGWLAIPHPAGGGGLELVPVTRPEGLRSPAHLAFNAAGTVDEFRSVIVTRGDVVMGRGAVIRTDALGSVAFRGETVTIHGSVHAPGGAISINGAARFPSNNSNPAAALPTVYIGSGARLSTAGKVVTFLHPRGWRRGTVYPGGTISLTGNIVAERGSLLDVSGASGEFDLPHSFLGVDERPRFGFAGMQRVPVRFDSNAGAITLAGGEMLYSDATLVGRPGGPSAIGGSLTVSSGRFYPAGAARTSADENLVVAQSGWLLPPGVARGVGVPLVDGEGNPLPGIGRFAIGRFAGGGFDALALNGNVRFSGPVDIRVPGRLRVASGGVIYADDAVRLAAPYVALGQAFQPPRLPGEEPILFTSINQAGVSSPYFFPPTHGGGSLTVIADLIDVGNLSLQGIGTARLLARRGDIRGNGTLNIAGDLTLAAGQVYPTTLGAFNLFAHDYNAGAGAQPGSISVLGGSSRPLPLSGGGTLSLYASQIVQGGTLRAPLGVINLGWDGSGSAPANPLAGTTIAAPVTAGLVLAEGSTTSVSAVDPRTGRGLLIPYGISLDGVTWADPAGLDITLGGLPEKAINLAAGSVTTAPGATLDIRGGGDLYAYRWIEGKGGSSDILASNNRFAVIPGYGFNYAPFAPFNPSAAAANLGGAAGYTNPALRVGDQITLGGVAGLRAGTYTLLPARYALLPGAFMVTPLAGDPVGSFLLPDGSGIASGYRFNSLDGGRAGVTTMARFEVAPGAVARQRAEYLDFHASDFLRASAVAREAAVPRLPVDSGYLLFSATGAMDLRGRVLSTAPSGGRGSLVDINSPVDIVINASGSPVPGRLVLAASQLNSFNAESLLIGGVRRPEGGGGARITVNTGNLTVDNSGSPLAGSDIILVARGTLELAAGAEVRGSGAASPADLLLLGDDAVAGSGNGTLLRVSATPDAQVLRRGVGDSVVPNLMIGPGATVAGGGITLDSTYATALDPTARLLATTVNLNSGQISIQLDPAVSVAPTAGLVLAGPALASLQAEARALSFLSYTSLDLYGGGLLGSRADFDSLTLRAPLLRGFVPAGAGAVFAAGSITLENPGNLADPLLPGGPLAGTLVLDANRITLGANAIRADGLATVEFAAAEGLLATGAGSFATGGDLLLTTPVVTGAQASNHSIRAGGLLALDRPAGALAGLSGGLGATLELRGGRVEINSDIALPSGELTLRAVSGDLILGNRAAARIDLGGVARPFLDLNRFTGGGVANLVADAGSVRVAAPARIEVGAPAGGGDAGRIAVAAPAGGFELSGTIDSSAGAGGRAGSFQLDAGAIPGGSLAALDAVLNAGRFALARDYRIRSGDVLVDGAATAASYRVSADQGSILASGRINAAGPTGGQIDLKATGSLVLLDGSRLDVSAQDFDAAGKGGAITLEAGAQRDGTVDSSALLDLRAGASLDLGVASAVAGSPDFGRFTGTLHLRAPRNAAQTDLQIAPIGAAVAGASAVTVEGYRLYDLTGTGTISSTVQNQIRNDATAFLGAAGATTPGYTAMLGRLTSLNPALDLILMPGAELLNRGGSLTLGATNSNASADWNLASWRFGPRAAPGVLTLRAAENLVFFNALSDGFGGGSSLWLSPLLPNNPLLPANSQSWSLRLTAGADTGAASHRAVRPLASLGAESGILALGKNMGAATATGGANATTASLMANNFQVLRTGSGDIEINAGRSVRLLNPFASIYTAGTQVADPTRVLAAGDFSVPILDQQLPPLQGGLGPSSKPIPRNTAWPAATSRSTPGTTSNARPATTRA
jgi:filamentous hemagglutinin